jgi:hypothetical protein
VSAVVESCDFLDGDSYDHDMAARSPTGEWCLPTHEISGSHLIRLRDKSRENESAPREWIHDEPTRKSPSGAMEALAARAVLATPKPIVVSAPRPSRPPPAVFAPSESEIDQAMALLEVADHDEQPAPPVATPTKPASSRSTKAPILFGMAVLGGIVVGYFCI